MINTGFPMLRLRRLRQHPILRDLVRETELNVKDLVFPLFIKDRDGEKVPIASMPGHFQIPLNKLPDEIDEIQRLGITSVLLFGVPAHKDSMGSDSYSDAGIIQEAIRAIRNVSSNILIISDVLFL